MNPEEFDEKFIFKQTYQYGENDKPIHYYEYLSKNTLVHIWPSSKLFLDLIDHNPKIIENKTIFDVGCGTGVTGIGSLINGAKECLFFDYLPERFLKPIISRNIEINQIKNEYSIHSEDWRSPSLEFLETLEKKIDVVFAGDCLYEEENYLGFFGLMCEILERNPECEIYLTYHERGNPDPILTYADGFDLAYIDSKDFLKEDFGNLLKIKFLDVYLMRLVKKKK